MTVLLNQDRLRLIGAMMEHPIPEPRRQVPTMQWAVDVETGRPVATWVLSDERRALATA